MVRKKDSFNKKTKKTRRNAAIAGFVFALGFIGLLGYLKFTGNLSNASYDEIKTIELSSFKTLEEINSGNLKNKYLLKNDIYIEKNFTIGSKNNFFNGEINGNGRTIYVNYKTTNSLFYGLGKNAHIKNLSIVYTSGTDSMDNDFGGVAKINYGTIEDCSIVFDDYIVASNATSIGGVAAHNFGKITNTFAKTMIDDTDHKQIETATIGGIVGKSFKDSSLKNCVTIMASKYLLEHYEEMYDKKINIVNIGAISGSNFEGENLYSLDSKSIFFDRNYNSIEFVDENTMESGEFYRDRALFNELVWLLQDGQYPQLKNS